MGVLKKLWFGCILLTMGCGSQSMEEEVPRCDYYLWEAAEHLAIGRTWFKPYRMAETACEEKEVVACAIVASLNHFQTVWDQCHEKGILPLLQGRDSTLSFSARVDIGAYLSSLFAAIDSLRPEVPLQDARLEQWAHASGSLWVTYKELEVIMLHFALAAQKEFEALVEAAEDLDVLTLLVSEATKGSIEELEITQLSEFEVNRFRGGTDFCFQNEAGERWPLSTQLLQDYLIGKGAFPPPGEYLLRGNIRYYAPWKGQEDSRPFRRRVRLGVSETP